MPTRDVNALFVYPKTRELPCDCGVPAWEGATQHAPDCACLRKQPPPRWQIVLGERLGRRECPYLHRWLVQTPVGSLRLHHWFRSDDKRAKHDHPSDFLTVVLAGSYTDLAHHPCADDTGGLSAQRYGGVWECDRCGQAVDEGMKSMTQRMKPGRFAFRKAEHRHTVAVDPGGCWTLLWFMPDRRNWGFWVPRKIDGRLKFQKANKYFIERGHHPCDQP